MPSGAVTVGGLVINLAAETSQLKTDMAEGARAVDTGAKAMINSMAGIAESSDRSTDAGARMVRQLKEEIATFGMTSEQITQYKANLNGVGTEVESLVGRLGQMKAAQAGFTDQLAASEAQATQRIKEMVAASLMEVSAMNDVTAATQGVINAQTAATSTGRSLAETQRLQILNMQGVAASMRTVQEGTVAMSADTQRILAQYDPLGAKLRSLQADLATLRKEMGNSVDPAAIKAFQGLEDEIAKTQALMAKAAAQANTLGGATSQLTQTQTQLIDRFKQQAETVGMSRSQLMAYQAAQLGVTEQTKDFIAKIKEQEDALKRAARAKEDERNATFRMGDALKTLAAGYAALKIGEYLKDITMVAARYETLGVVLEVVGRTAGYTKTQMDAASEGVARQGITMTESRNSVIKLVQAHVDLKNASTLARIAQDAAVIGNINSSEAFERLVNGVSRGNVLILRNIGINVNLQAAYAQMADSLGKSTRELTENERVQARLNAVLERGADIAGTYEAAMDTASKQITSMKRYTEDLKTTFGEVFTETLTIGVMALTDELKDANGEVSELAKNGQLAEWGRDLTNIFVGVANAISNILTGAKMAGTWAAHFKASGDVDTQYRDKYAKAADADKPKIRNEWVAALTREQQAYESTQTALAGDFDRFQRAADERMAARLAKQKTDSAERLKVDQDYAARATALLIANADKSIEVQQAAQANLAKQVYQGTPNYRDSEVRESKPKVDQADNIRLQNALARTQEMSAIDKSYAEYSMQLDDMRHKASKLGDEEYFKSKKENLSVIFLSEQEMYDKQLQAIKSHHNSTDAEREKSAKAIADIEGKKEAARVKYDQANLLMDEGERLRLEGVTSASEDATNKYTSDLQRQLQAIELATGKREKSKSAIEEETVALYEQSVANMKLQVSEPVTEQHTQADHDAAVAMLADLEKQLGLHKDIADALKDQEAVISHQKMADQAIQDWKRAGDAIADSLNSAFGSGGKAAGLMFRAYSEGASGQLQAQKRLAEAKKLSDDNPEKANAIARAHLAGAKAQIQSYGDMAGAAKGFFEEHSAGYRAMEAAEKTFRAFEVALSIKSMVEKSGLLTAFTGLFVASKATQTAAEGTSTAASTAMAGTQASAWGITAVVKAIASMPFPLNIAAGAATLAAVVAIGAKMFGSVGSGSVSLSEQRQKATGTGSVLGDATAKSESIAKAIELSASNSNIELNYTAGMLRSLRAIESSLSGLGGILAQNGVNGLAPGSDMSSPNSIGRLLNGGALGAPFITILDKLTGGWVSKTTGQIVNAIFGGKVSTLDVGVMTGAATVGGVRSVGLQASSYADTKTDGGWFHSDKYRTATESLGPEANAQFSQAVRDMADAVQEAGKLLGLGGDAFTQRLNSFVVDLGKISTKDLKADEIQKQLEAAFSKVGDDMARWSVDGLTQLQKVGEGALETLVRVAANYANLDAVLASVGKTFGATGLSSIKARESFIELAGGIDELASKTAGFAENFLTEAERLAPVQKYVADQLASMGLAGLRSRESFKQYVLGLDMSSEAQRQQFVALMDLQEAFAKVYPEIVDTTITLAGAKTALADAYNAETEAIGATIDRMSSFASSLRSLRNSAVLGNLSPLSPVQKYAEAKAQYEAVLSAARGGDESAQSNYQAAFTSFLEASRTVFASSGQYQQDFYYAQAATEEAARWAEAEVDVGKAQLTALERQVSGLIEVKQEVMSVRDAILQLNAVMGKNTAPLTAVAPPVNTPIPYSSYGTPNTEALVAAVKSLSSENAMLRAEQRQQTGDLIRAVQGSADSSSDKISGAVKAAATTEVRVLPE